MGQVRLDAVETTPEVVIENASRDGADERARVCTTALQGCNQDIEGSGNQGFGLRI